MTCGRQWNNEHHDCQTKVRMAGACCHCAWTLHAKDVFFGWLPLDHQEGHKKGGEMSSTRTYRHLLFTQNSGRRQPCLEDGAPCTKDCRTSRSMQSHLNSHTRWNASLATDTFWGNLTRRGTNPWQSISSSSRNSVVLYSVQCVSKVSEARVGWRSTDADK